MSARALACASVLVATSASASTPYPGALREDLALSKTPACTLCHAPIDGGEPPDGGESPATQPFARSMQARGLRGGGDVTSVATALAAMRRDGVDSDGDGARDLDELSWGGDPNVPDLPVTSPDDRPVETYGCVRTSRTEPRRRAWTMMVALVLAIAARRASRHRLVSRLTQATTKMRR